MSDQFSRRVIAAATLPVVGGSGDEALPNAKNEGASNRDRNPPIPVRLPEGPILGASGNVLVRPLLGRSLEDFATEGAKDHDYVIGQMLKGGANATAAAVYEGQQLGRFLYGDWDQQRLTGTFDERYRDYATVAIGVYAAAVGIPEWVILEAQNAVAGRYKEGTQFDVTYPRLPVQNVDNTNIGCRLFQSGKIRARSGE